MRYSVRGEIDVSPSYWAETVIDMDAWCRAHCAGRWAFVNHEEVLFDRVGDAERFAAEWFFPHQRTIERIDFPGRFIERLFHALPFAQERAAA